MLREVQDGLRQWMRTDMAHKVLDIIEAPVKKRKAFKVPDVQGKFGLALFIGGKEIFIGITMFPVVMEQVVKRRLIKPVKGTAKVFNFEY